MSKTQTENWCEWGGGLFSPLRLDARVEVRLRNGETKVGYAEEFGWSHDSNASDIIAYRAVDSKPKSDDLSDIEPRITDDVIEAAATAGLKAKPCLQDFTRAVLTEGLRQIETVDPDLTHEIDRLRRDRDSMFEHVAQHGSTEMRAWFLEQFPDFAIFAKTNPPKESASGFNPESKAEVQSDIEEVGSENRSLKERIAALERLRPHWAQGYSSDSIAAQVTTAALSELWNILGAKNQTEAVAKARTAVNKESDHAPSK